MKFSACSKDVLHKVSEKHEQYIHMYERISLSQESELLTNSLSANNVII